ncbi:MAG TPA: hypothetical protein VN258_12740, partial [Mobilitalea sp.]|nr:hypothetical protein [Mobilitalea sp.]
MKRLIAGFMAFCMITALCADYHPQTSASAEELSAGAVSGNAIDTVYFGDTTSETEHNFTNNLNYSSNSVAGVDDGTLSDGLGDGLTFRYLTPPGGDKLSMIQFTLKASITEQNYLTIRLSGSQGEHGNLLLLGENGDKSVINPIMMTAWGELDSAWGFGEDKVPYEGRYYYDTYIIPSNMVKSNGTVTLCIAATGVSNPYGSGTWDKQIMNSKYIYSAATHTNAYYKPADNLDSAHRAPAHNPAVTDQATINQNYTELSNQLNAAMEKVMSWQLYGDYWNTNIKNSSNAYLEGAVISLHDIKQYSSFMYKKYTKAQWAKIATQFGVNFQNWEVFGTTSLYVTALTNSYSGARYYENTDFLNRIFSTYDFIERAQEASGGWCIPSSGDEAFTWYGADYYGTGERKTTAYYTPLMKLGSDFLVQSFLELCNYIKNCDNAELKAAFYTKLNEKIDGDLTGRNNRTRRDYYIDMFAKLRNFLNNPNGKDFYDPDSKAGTLNQDFGFAYTANEAVRLLYDTATPGARLNTKYAPANPKEYIQQIKYKFGEMVDGQKWFSANGLGLEGGASHGGWAGDYGALVLKQVTHYAEIGQYFEDAEIKDLFNKTAYDLYNAASYFMYDSVDTATRNSVLTSEVTASSRNNGYTQKLFYNLAGYVATTLGNDAALRVMQKFIEDNRAATNTIMEATTSVHVYDNLTTEQEIVKYYQK